MKAKLMGLLKGEEGQGMVEYGLLIALISVAAITIIVQFGPKLVAIFQSALTALTT